MTSASTMDPIFVPTKRLRENSAIIRTAHIGKLRKIFENADNILTHFNIPNAEKKKELLSKLRSIGPQVVLAQSTAERQKKVLKNIEKEVAGIYTEDPVKSILRSLEHSENCTIFKTANIIASKVLEREGAFFFRSFEIPDSTNIYEKAQEMKTPSFKTDSKEAKEKVIEFINALDSKHKDTLKENTNFRLQASETLLEISNTFRSMIPLMGL